ncbi:MAG: P-loop NTPase [Spirochaetaceae bacterium]
MSRSEQILKVLRGVMHPELDRDLVDLGMIERAEKRDGRIIVTVAVPFKEIPIRDELVNRVRRALKEAYREQDAEVTLVEMSQQARAAFMAAAQGGAGAAESANHVDRVVAVLSGKGGVGKSSVAALLATALRRRGKQVGVLDADITGPSIPKMFGLRSLPEPVSGGILPAVTPGGIKVISINLFMQDEQQALIWRGPLISKAIKQFWGDVLWERLDYLVVDLPPGTSDASLTVMQSIPLDGVLLVTSPQDLAGMVVAKAAHMAGQMKAPILGMVENMSFILCPYCHERIEVFGPSHAGEHASGLGVRLIGRLPLDPELGRLCDTGRIEEYPAEAFEPVVGEIERRAKRLVDG